jgi:hypothetical protein
VTKFPPILRILLVAGFVLAAVAMPWVQGVLPAQRADALQQVSTAATAQPHECCCGGDGTCCCCAEESSAGIAEVRDQACSECRCGESPANSDSPGVYLLLAGVTPVGWRPPTPLEIVGVPATPLASVCRILAGFLPVTDTAQRLALTGVRTT